MRQKLAKNETFSLGAVKFINEFCKPLSNKGLTHFTHDITFGMGQISMLMNDKNVLMFYFQNKMPAICTDETGRTFEVGSYLGKVLREHYQDAAIILPQVPLAQNSLHVCEREVDRQQLYSFYFDMPENNFLHWIVNNGNLLTEFVDSYKLKARDIILEAMEPESRTVLPLFNNSFHQINESFKPFQIKISHKTTHQKIYLATQQSIALMHLSKGKTAKEIAKAMQLSCRTVEHYLARVREILGCKSNRELIAAYSEQIYIQKLI